MRHRVCLLALCLTVLLLISATEGKRLKGKIQTNKEFEFLAKFCFDETFEEKEISGEVKFELKTNTVNQKMLMFFDENDSWHAVYSNMPCAQKSTLASLSSGEIIPKVTMNEMWTITSSSRPRFWYLAAAACKDQTDKDASVDLEYDIHFLNPGGFWRAEFSKDEQGLAEMYLTFTILFALYFILQGVGVVTLSRLNAFHTIVKALSASILLQLVSCMFYLTHYISYGYDGVGSPFCYVVGQLLDMATQLLFMALLIVLAKGWTITSTRLTQSRGLLVVLGVYAFVYSLIFLWDALFDDPASTLYIYESWPGSMLIFLRLCTLVWFLFTVWDTYIHEMHPSKRKFFVRFAFFYSVWFVSLPIVVVVAHFVDPWYRLKTVTGMYLCFNLFSLSILSFLLWPTRAGDYFQLTPEGIEMPTLGDMSDDMYNPTSGRGSVDSYGRGPSASVDSLAPKA